MPKVTLPPLPIASMMTYEEWQQRWPQAALELHALMTHGHYAPPPDGPGSSESYVSSAIRLEAARHGVLLWRNQVGALPTPDGGLLRYGLANDSTAVNSRIKSADLIGIRRTLVTPQHVGTTLGVFVSREAKHANWSPGEKAAHESKQYAWASLVQAWGGDAKIVSGPGSF